MLKTEKETINLLLRNSVALQKMLVDLATNLKILNKRVSSLLSLFEEESKSFRSLKARPRTGAAPAGIEELSDKIDDLVEQNRTIAKGVLLLERTLKETKGKKIKELEPEEEEEKFGEEEEEERERKTKALPGFSL